MRIFLDANILFSATKSDGAVRALLAMLRTAGHELYADAYVIEEARRNLALKGPADALAALAGLLEQVLVVPMAVPLARPQPLPLPAKDRPVLESAIRGGCTVLVTGDRTHFGNLYGSTIEGVEILSPAQLARKL